MSLETHKLPLTPLLPDPCTPTPLPPRPSGKAAMVAKPETDWEDDLDPDLAAWEAAKAEEEEYDRQQLELGKLMEESAERHTQRVEAAAEYAVKFPQAALKGSLAELAHTLLDDTEVPVEFGFMSGMTAFGLIASEHLRIAGDGLGIIPNLYTVLVAPTGGKKSTAVTKVVDFFLKSKYVTRDLDDFANTLVFPKAGSGEGLLKLFYQWKKVLENGKELWKRQERTRVLLTPDEFQEMLNKCRLENSTLAPEITSLFDGTVAGNATRDKKDAVDKAHLGIIGCITTKLWDETWAQGSERSLGLLNRLFLVSSLPRPQVFSPPPANQEKLYELRTRIDDQIQKILRSKPLEITADAMEEFKKFYLQVDPSQEEATRIETIVKKLAMVLAATNDKDRIDLGIAKMAISLGLYQLQVRKLLNPSEAQNAVAQCENRLMAYLERHPNVWFSVNRLADRTKLQKAIGSGIIIQALKNLVTIESIETQGLKKFRFVPTSSLPAPSVI
jgi:hypothetical protein